MKSCNCVTEYKSYLQKNVIILLKNGTYLLACVISFSSFDEVPQTYVVNENAGPAQPVVVLSNPSSSDVIVQVSTTDGSATGEY